jgi:very-short-patch-repair endonuclease
VGPQVIDLKPASQPILGSNSYDGGMERFPTVLIPSAIAAAQSPLQVQSILQQTLPPLGVHMKAPRGHSEKQFEHDLWRYFPGKIQTGLMVRNIECQQPYVPDFAYIDPALNLHIDIEIDEPYTYDTRQPIHYLGSKKDQQRNQYFLDQGWLIIRFSEEQVVRSPASCCKAIASAIATLLGDSTMLNPFRQVPTLKPQKRWTQAEAQSMAEQSKREKYLVAQAPTQTASKSQERQKQTSRSTTGLMRASFTFYCPECGDGPIRWQGHYVSCPTCHYDEFVL